MHSYPLWLMTSLCLLQIWCSYLDSLSSFSWYPLSGHCSVVCLFHVWFTTKLILWDGFVSPMPNPQPGGPCFHTHTHMYICMCIYVCVWEGSTHTHTHIYTYTYTLEPGWPSYTPGHWVLSLVAFYDTHELRWSYSHSPVTTQGLYPTVNFKIHSFFDLLHSRNRISMGHFRNQLNTTFITITPATSTCTCL
jgi:hypothetical protein